MRTPTFQPTGWPIKLLERARTIKLPAPFNAGVERLDCSVLDELASVLEGDGNTHWGGWMRKARAHLLNSDYAGIEYLLSAYGGAGSLSDVVLGRSYKEGVFAWKPGHIELNEKFTALSSKAWELADAIKRSQ